jgi:hypothetical protein
MTAPNLRTGQTRYSEVAISNAIERFLGVPATAPGFSSVLSRMQMSPLAAIDLDSQEFRNLVLQNGGAQLKEEAERQQRQKNNNDSRFAANEKFDAFGRPIAGGVFGMAMTGRGDRGANSNSSRYDGAPGRTLGITNPAFAASLGVSGATISGLAALGFTQPGQIQALVQDAKSLGIDRNRGSLNLGLLKKFDGGNYQSHMNFFNSYKQGLSELNDFDRRIAAETDPAKKAALQRQRAEKEKRLEEQRKKQRAKIKNDRGKKGFDGVIDDLKKDSKKFDRTHGADATRHGNADTHATDSKQANEAAPDLKKKMVKEDRKTMDGVGSLLEAEAAAEAPGNNQHAEAPTGEQSTQKDTPKKQVVDKKPNDDPQKKTTAQLEETKKIGTTKAAQVKKPAHSMTA